MATETQIKPKTFAELPRWTDVEQSPSYQAWDQKTRKETFDIWQQRFIETATEDPDGISPERWEGFKKFRKEKGAELTGASGFSAATQEADDEAATEAPDRLSLVARKREIEKKAAKLFGGVEVAKLAPEERDEYQKLTSVLGASDEDDFDAVEEVANDDREFHVTNGKFYASPSLALSKDRYREAVKNAPLTAEQKADALMQGVKLREEVGARLRGDLKAVDEAFSDTNLFGVDWMPSIGGTDKFNQFERDYRQNVNPDATDADVMERWQDENGSWYSNLGTQIKLGALRGASDTLGAYYGIKRLVGMADEETVARSEAATKLSGQLAAGSEATGGATLASDAASMIYSSLATAPAGLAGRGVVAGLRGVGTLAGRTAAAVTAGRVGAGTLATAAALRAGGAAAAKIEARRLAMAKAGGLAAASFAAGMQSAGGAFNRYFDEFLTDELASIPEAERTPEVVEAARRRARDGARVRAIVSGLITTAVTAGFGATGAEKLAAPQVSNAAQAAKESMAVFLGKALGKAAISEAPEEGLDEFANGLVDKIAIDPSKPISEIVADTLKAAVAGGLLGAGMSAPYAIADLYEARKKAKQNPAIQQQLQTADNLDAAGAPASAAALRQSANQEVTTQADLDRQAAQAQADAEAALQAQPAYRPATEVARAVEGQLNALPADDPQREELQQRLEGLRMAISANPDAMVPMLEPEQAATAEGAADPFAPPGEAPAAEEAPVATPAVKETATVPPPPLPLDTATEEELTKDIEYRKQLASEFTYGESGDADFQKQIADLEAKKAAKFPAPPAGEETPAATPAPVATAAAATPAQPPTPAAPAPLAAPFKTPPQPRTPKTDDTQAKEPQAGGVPPVEGQPAVRVPEGQTETRAPSGTRQGKAAPGKKLTKAEQRKVAIEETRRQTAELTARLSAQATPAAVKPGKRGKAAPAAAPSQQDEAEARIVEGMLRTGVIPSSSEINMAVKALTGKGPSNGSPEARALEARVRKAWTDAHPPEGGNPDDYFTGSKHGSAMKPLPAKKEAIDNAGGAVPFKLVNGERVGFFTNDPVLTAKQINSGLKVTVPAELRGKLANGIEIDEATGRVTAAYDYSRGSTPVTKAGDWHALFLASPQRQARIEAMLKEGENVTNKTGKTMEQLADDLRAASNRIADAISGKRPMSPEALEALQKEQEEYKNQIMALQKERDPRIPFVGTDAYLAQHAPAPVPGENDVLKEYLKLDSKPDADGMSYVEATVRKTLELQFPWLAGSDLVDTMVSAVYNSAMVVVRNKLLTNPGVDAASLQLKLKSFVTLTKDVLKKFSDAARTHRTLITGTIDDPLTPADQLTAGLAEEVAAIDAEVEAERLGEDEAAATPLTEDEVNELKDALQEMNDGEPDPFSLALLQSRPLQARRALAEIEQGIQFKVGSDGELIFEHGRSLSTDERTELDKILDGIVPPGSTDLAKRLAGRPDVARFLMEMTSLGRAVLRGVKTPIGAPMFKEADIRKKNLVEVFTVVHTGDASTAGRIVNQAIENISAYSGHSNLTQAEAVAVLRALLTESSRPTEVSGRTAPPTTLAEQRAQERVATLKTTMEGSQAVVDRSRAALIRIETRQRELRDRANELTEQSKNPNLQKGAKDEIRAKLAKINSELTTLNEDHRLTDINLRNATDSLQQATRAYAAVNVKTTPPPAEVLAAAKAKVESQLKAAESKGEAKRRAKTSPAPTKAVKAGVRPTKAIAPDPVNTAEDRSMFKSELAVIGLADGADRTSLLDTLKRMSLAGAAGTPYFKSLSRIFGDKPALLDGIDSVAIIEDPALAADVSVVDGVLTVNVAAMTPTLDGTPRAPEALLRGLVTHAVTKLTTPGIPLTSTQQAALAKLEELRQEAAAMEAESRPDGLQPRFTDALKDTASFMQAVLTSPEFGSMLQSYQTKVKTPGLKSAWGRFWLALGELLTGKPMSFGSGLHASLMTAGDLMAKSPSPGKRFLDSIKAVLHNPEIAFPKSRTAGAAEIAHQKAANEAVELADSPATLDTVEARLTGDDSAAADPEGVSELDAALMPDDAALGSAPATDVEGSRIVTVPRVQLPPPAGSDLLTEQQAYAGLADAIRTIDTVDKVARGVITAGEAGAAVLPSAIQSALDKITTAIERLKGSPATNKDQFIAVLEDMQAFLQLELDQIVTPPAKFDAMSEVVSDIDTEALPDESDIPFAEVDEEAIPFAEPYIETVVEDGTKEAIDFAPFLRRATTKTGRKVAMVDAGPGVPEQPLYVRHDRKDTTIYMNRGAMTELVKKLRALGYNKSELNAQLNALLDREASTLAILQRFSDGELLATARSLSPEQRRRIIKRVYGLNPGDPGFLNYFSTGNSGYSPDVTADMIQLGADYYRMMRQVSETGHTSEDVMDMIAASPGTFARTVAFLKATANQFATWWRAYGDVNATRAIVNIDEFLRAVTPTITPAPAAKTPKPLKPSKHEAAQIVASIRGTSIDEVLADARSVARIREDMRRNALSGETPETTQLSSQELESFVKDTLGLVEGDGSSVATALARIADLPGVNPATRAIAAELSKNPDVKKLSNLLFVVGAYGAHLSTARPSGFYHSSSHALALNLAEISSEFSHNKKSSLWSKAWLVEVLVHEATHAVTTLAIYRHDQGISQPPKVEAAIRELSALHRAVKTQKGADKFRYELSNLDEFAAAVMSNHRFVEWLSTVPASVGSQVPGAKGPRSFIKRVLSSIYRIVFPDLEIDSVMEKSLARIFDIASYPHVVVKPSGKAFGGAGVFQDQSLLYGAGQLLEVEVYQDEAKIQSGQLIATSEESEQMAEDADAFLDEQDELDAAADEIAAYEAKLGTGTYYAPSPILPGKDAEYLRLVEGGDSGKDNLNMLVKSTPVEGRAAAIDQWSQRNPRATKALQSAVNKAAWAAGYRDKGWHASPSLFNEFDAARGMFGDQTFHFSPTGKDNAGYGKYNRKFFLKIKKPYASSSTEYFQTVQAAELERLSNLGFDAILGDDPNMGGSGFRQEEIVIFSPEQIKSSDFITYDDAGNVILPSKRFQLASPDIRFAPSPMLPGKVTGERKSTEALKNSLPAMPARVQDYLKGSTYFSGVAKADIEVIDGLIGGALSRATGAADFGSIANRLASLPMTDPQRFLARVVVGQALNKRVFDLQEAMVKAPTPGGLTMLAAFEAEAASVWHTVQDIASTSGQMLSAAAIARDLINPRTVSATYRDAATKVSGEKLPKDAKDLFSELKREMDDVASGVVKRSTLTKKIVEAMTKAAGGNPSEVQMMFDFMDTLPVKLLQDLRDRGTGVPIPAKMADWVADRIFGMVETKIREQVKQVAGIAGASEQTFFEEYSNEVKRLVALRVNAALADVAPPSPDLTPSQQEAAKREALDSAIRKMVASFDYAPSVERAFNQSKAKLLARLEADKGSTPEALKQYEAAKAAIAAMELDIVPMQMATDIIRRSFDMREQVYLSLSDQHASVAQVAAMISSAAGLTADQSRKVAEAFKTAYEAEANRRIQKTLTNYAQRRSMFEGRGGAERYSRSERFLRLARIGGLRKEEFYNAMATEFGLPSYDPAIAEELDREADRIAAMPVGSVQRNDATRELNARIVKETYRNLLDTYGAKAIVKDRSMLAEYIAGVPVAMWKSAVLSGFGTAEVNFGYGTIQSVMDLGFNASAYAVKAKDPALAASNLLTLMRAVGWIADPLGRKEVWTEIKRAALTGRTRFASEQSENMLVLERDIPTLDTPGIKQLMSSAKTFYKLLGRIGAVIDATVSVPASLARQRLALQYALTMGGADRQKIKEVLRKSFSPDELESREINAILDSERDQFRNSPRPDLAMEARRYQLLEQRRAQTYAELTSRMEAKDKEDFMEASRESARFANLGTTPTGIAGAVFDSVFGKFERKTKGLSSIIVSFPRAMGNLLDFSLAMSFPFLSFARANNVSPSRWFLSENSRYQRERVEGGSVKYWKLMSQGLVATVAQFTIASLFAEGLDDEEEGRVPWFMVYGKGYPDSERNRQLRYRQPKWSPYTVKIGDFYLSWKDIPGFNLLLGGLASYADDRMVQSLKDPKKIRKLESAANTTVAFIKAVTVKNSLQGLAQAGELLSDNDLAEAMAATGFGKMVANFIGGATNPRLMRDVVSMGRGLAGDGTYTLKDTRGLTAAAISMLPANELYGAELGQRDMVNTMGDPVTNFWYAPATKRILPSTAGPTVDPIITPLVSAGLFLSPPKGSQMSFDTYEDGSDEIDTEGGLLNSFEPEVEVDAIKMFGEQMRERMTPEYIKELTDLAAQGQEGRKAAQKMLNDQSTAARDYAKRIIQERIFNREIVPHWQAK